MCWLHIYRLLAFFVTKAGCILVIQCLLEFLRFLRGCVGGVLRRSARKQGIDPVLQFDPRAALGHLQFHPQIVVSAKDDAGVRDVLVGV